MCQLYLNNLKKKDSWEKKQKSCCSNKHKPECPGSMIILVGEDQGFTAHPNTNILMLKQSKAWSSICALGIFSLKLCVKLINSSSNNREFF